MRNQILVALLGIAAMFTGCSQEDGTLAPSENKTASFTVAVNDGAVTRAVTEPEVKPTRYIMELYEAATATGTPTRVEQAANTFDVVLKDGADYTVLFWADYGTPNGADNVFDAAKLTEVKIAAGKTATQAAFAGAVKFKVGTDDALMYTAVTLKHAVAQVNFKQAGTLTANPSKLTVKYPESYSLNVEGSAVTKIAGEVTHELACNAVTTGVIATDYIIASDDDKTIMNIEATLEGETKKEIPNAPFRRNYATNISGAYSDKYGATLTVTCDDVWAGNNDKEIANGFIVGDFYPAKATKENAIGVVFWVDPNNAAKGKVMAMDEARTSWSKVNVTTSAISAVDGIANTNTIKNIPNYGENYLGFAWCIEKGTGWYIPAKNELLALYAAWSADKDGFAAKLRTDISADSGYWSSTEVSSSQACSVYFESGQSVNNDKDMNYCFRPIFAF